MAKMFIFSNAANMHDDYSKGIYLLLHDQTVSQIISDEHLLVSFIVVVGKHHLAAVMQYYLHEQLHFLLVGIWSNILVYMLQGAHAFDTVRIDSLPIGCKSTIRDLQTISGVEGSKRLNIVLVVFRGHQ